jgi:hypothetical protein
MTLCNPLYVAPDELSDDFAEEMREYILRRSTRVPSGCWEWRAGAANYRPRAYLGDRSRVAARASFMAFKREAIPASLFVCHSCDNLRCVNPDHLWLGSCRDNNVDAWQKNLQPSRAGLRNGRAKLGDADVAIIRRDLARGEHPKALARRFDVSPPAIYLIRNGETWKHVAAAA